MSIHDLLTLIGQLLANLLADKFTGKIVVTIHCRDGGIGKAISNVEREFYPKKELFFKKDLTTDD